MRGIRILLSFDFYLHTDHLNQPTQRYWPSICFTLNFSFILRRQRAEFAALALPPMVRYNRRSRSTGSAELINPVGEFVRHPIPWAVHRVAVMVETIASSRTVGPMTLVLRARQAINDRLQAIPPDREISAEHSLQILISLGVLLISIADL